MTEETTKEKLKAKLAKEFLEITNTLREKSASFMVDDVPELALLCMLTHDVFIFAIKKDREHLKTITKALQLISNQNTKSDTSHITEKMLYNIYGPKPKAENND